MARYTGAVCRQCRREGMKLFLKGDKCYTEKCAIITRKSSAPGQHGKMKKKLSEYGMQHREKQKIRRYYGVLEKQFAGYFDIAEKKQGITGENLLQILESRLDNVVYRLGWGMSRPEARQLVRHGHFTVDGKKVNIPSYRVKPGQVIAIKEKSRGSEKIKTVLEATGSKVIPKWLDLNRDTLEAKVVSLSSREDIDIPMEETLVVELYSK